MEDVVARAADQLYAVPPRRFVHERTAAAATARAAGDRRAAAAIGRLRRPTVAAWLVNLLALQRPELVAQFSELADSLRRAQRQLDGAQLRELAAQRRATVSGLVAEAKSLARASDPEVSEDKLPLAEVEATLLAALADAEVAEQMRSGRLVRAERPAGFGEPAKPALRLVTEQDTGGGPAAAAPAPARGEPETAPPATEQAAQAATRVAREQAESALGQARAAATAARAEWESCRAQQQAAEQEVAEVDAALAELSARRSVLAGQLTSAEAAAFRARRELAQAEERVAAAEAALAQLPQ